MGRSKGGGEGRRQCRSEERIRHQPKGSEFQTATPLICLVLSATDKLGQMGEEEEKSDEEENKEHLISAAGAPVREGKLYQLAKASPISTLATTSLRLFQGTQSTFLIQTLTSVLTPLLPASAHTHTRGCTREHTPTHMPVDTHRLKIELEWRQSRLVSQPRIKPNPIKNVF